MGEKGYGELPGGEKKSRSIWDFFSVTEGGRLKSTFLLYSFALGFVYLAVYLLLYALLLGPIDGALPAAWPVWAKNLVECLLPGALGTPLCLLFYVWSRDKRIVPAGFLWMTAYLLILLAGVLLLAEKGERLFFLRLFGMYAAGPVIMGCGASFWLHRRYRKSG